MSVYTDWRDKAKQWNGVNVVWTLQGEALKNETNPDARLGVCRALVLDWIFAQKTTQGIAAYINQFNTGKTDTNGDPVPYIPPEIIKKQLDWTLFKAAIPKLELEIAELKKQSKSATTQEQQLDAYRKFVDLGADGYMDLATFDEVGEALDGADGEGYYALVMRRDPSKGQGTGGHTIGFGFRTTGTEIFDPNLGLFFFKKNTDMVSFFRYDVNAAFPYETIYSKLRFLVYEKFLPSNAQSTATSSTTNNTSSNNTSSTTTSSSTSTTQSGGGQQNP